MSLRVMMQILLTMYIQHCHQLMTMQKQWTKTAIIIREMMVSVMMIDGYRKFECWNMDRSRICWNSDVNNLQKPAYL